MANLIYSMIASLDGYTADQSGDFSWAAPDQELHAFVNDLERPVATYLYGRRMYEVMRYWETAHIVAGQPRVVHDFAAIWQSAEKIVYSRTLRDVSSSRTRLERNFDPEVVRRMKASEPRNMSVGGANLAAQAISAGLVDELHLFVVPTIVGGGTQSLPRNIRIELELMDEHRFRSGAVHMHYRVQA